MNDALKLAIALVQRFEGCKLESYPDPATGGAPWTIGYGETLGITEGMVWTQEQADTALYNRVAYFLLRAYMACPQLHSEPPERVAACVSLAYNIGAGAFAASSVRSRTSRREYAGAGNAFLLWSKAAGHVLLALITRRKAERRKYLG